MSLEHFLRKKGIAKNKEQANYVMIGIIVICLSYIFINIIGGNKSNAVHTEFSDAEMELMMMEEDNYSNQEKDPFSFEDESGKSASNGGYVDF